MPDYKAPLRDMRFVLNEVLDLDGHYARLGLEEVNSELLNAFLEEGAKFAENELSPLNRSGDEEGCHFEDTVVTTPKGFKEAYAKYVEGGSVHLIPAPISSDVHQEIMRLSALAHETLGCRGVSRADFRFDGDGLFLLEINTQPGMTATSLVPEQAAHVGMAFTELVGWMVENAECDQ